MTEAERLIFAEHNHSMMEGRTAEIIPFKKALPWWVEMWRPWVDMANVYR